MGEPDKTEHHTSWLTEESVDPADRTADGTHDSEAGAAEGRPRKDGEEPDVLLDVPHLNVDEIDLEVDKLRARVALQARVLDLLQLDVGADVDLAGVRLGIKGVQAQALLKVRLDNVESIIERVLQTIDENPQIVEAAARKVAETAGGVADSLGRTAVGATEGVGKAAEGVGRTAESVGGAAEGVGRTAEGAVGTASEAARDAAGGAELPGTRTAEEQTEGADTTSGEPEAGQEGTASGLSGEAAGPGRSDGAPDTGQDGGERSEAERETDGTDPEAAIERPEDRTADERLEDDSGHEQPDAGSWDRTWAEAEQVLSAVGQRLLKGLGAGAKQVGREVGGAASRVVRAAREGG
ncbi:hypothetical protein [Nocardiopsis xinjiangensis]|uniref:hypothetical protein n=1 Tax=Nocardiopsis xinjiangensis TaxID=124285 RepID=UPI00034712DE|nr:hypothetical protein [Nocardiopsis xinjiangensis]